METAIEAHKIIVLCCETIDKIKKTRIDILEKQENFKASLEGLNADLGAALVKQMFEPELSGQSQIEQIRKESRDTTLFLADAELILKALDVLELEKIEEKKDPQRIVRAHGEDQRMTTLNMQLQGQLLAMAAESEQFMHRDDFKNVAERFKRNALSLNQEQMADDFLRTVRG